jgi:uncharacterized protein YlzI (FlbEa/FlbD family)
MISGAKIFTQIKQSDRPDYITYINVHQIECVSEQPNGEIRIQLISGHTYIINEPIHAFLERIQFA